MGRACGLADAVHAGSLAAGAIGAIIWKTSYMGADEKLATFKRESFQGSQAVTAERESTA